MKKKNSKSNVTEGREVKIDQPIVGGAQRKTEKLEEKGLGLAPAIDLTKEGKSRGLLQKNRHR